MTMRSGISTAEISIRWPSRSKAPPVVFETDEASPVTYESDGPPDRRDREGGEWGVVEKEPPDPRELVHPVYLDLPMLASFDAALNPLKDVRGADTVTDANKAALEASLEAKGALLAASMKAGAKGSLGQESSTQSEYEFVFQRTDASLFNHIRTQLAGRVWMLPEVASGDPPDNHRIEVGQLVEMRGQILANPLDRLLENYDRVLPWAGLQPHAPSKQANDVPRDWRAFGRRSVGSVLNRFVAEKKNDTRLLGIIRDQVASNTVRDLVLRIEGEPPRWAVLVVANRYFTRETADYVLDGEFTVLGKVTRVFHEGARVKITRRTALGSMPEDRAKQFLARLRSDLLETGGALPDARMRSLVPLPAVQIVPLAIFV